MPISPAAQELAQMIQAMQQSQGQQSTAAASLLNAGQGAVGTQPSQAPSMQKLMQIAGGSPSAVSAAPQAAGAAASPVGATPAAGQSGGGLAALLSAISGQGAPTPPPQPQTLGINQPIPMALPQADPTTEQQAPQAPDVALGLALGG